MWKYKLHQPAVPLQPTGSLPAVPRPPSMGNLLCNRHHPGLLCSCCQQSGNFKGDFSCPWRENGTGSNARPLFPEVTHTWTLVSTCYLQHPEGLWRMTDCQQQGNLEGNTAVTPGKSYRVCSMPSPQRITCPQHPLKLQLTYFTVFTPSAVGKT